MIFLKAFLAKQAGKNIFTIILELIIRALSLLFFPIVWIVLFIVNLFMPVKISFLYHERLGHLALNTDLFMRRLKLGILPKNVHYLFFVYSPANRQLLTMFKRHLNIVESELLSKLISPIALFNTRFYQPLPFFGNEYYEFNKCDAILSFTDDEIRIGKEKLLEMGIGENDWYVCIFSRDHAYYQAFSPHADRRFSDHRNGDIDTYTLAIQYIVDNGGYVIRMGSCVEKPLSFKHARVIDYAIDYRSDFMDIFLSAHCKFYLSNTSGAVDIAVVFNKPVAGVNWVPIGYPPFGKNSIYIPKRIINCSTQQNVPFAAQLELFTGNQVGTYLFPEDILSNNNMMFMDNNDKEILEITIEMLDRINEKFIESEIYTNKLTRYFNLFPSNNIYKSNKTPICKYFLNEIVD